MDEITIPSGPFTRIESAATGYTLGVCASAGTDVTCWGSGWNEGVSSTIDFAQ